MNELPIEICNLSKQKPSRPYDFCVSRGTPLGNPFILRSEEHRDTVCDAYDAWFAAKKYTQVVELYLEKMRAALVLHGKLRLFCWCMPKRCHAETIRQELYRRLANA